MRDTLRTGRQSELKVVLKLLELGYPVFESVLPNAIDVLIRCKGDRWSKIQVKTCTPTKCGAAFPLQSCTSGNKPRGYSHRDVDYFAGVLGSSFYVIPYKRAYSDGVRSRYTIKRGDLGRWDLLPKPYAAE